MANWNISAAAIRNPIPSIVLVLALLFAGMTAFFRLPINQIPNIDFPLVMVTVAQPGASPTEMETQITQRVEAALTGVEGVNRITSTIEPGVSTTLVELRIGADLGRAVNDARDNVTRIRSDLPADIEDPVVQRMDAVSDPLAYYSVSWPGKTDEELSWFIDNTLTRELLSVKGVSAITRQGGVDREVRVDLDPERLLSFGVTADEVSRQLRAINADLPGGRAEVGGQAQSIRTLGGAMDVQTLAQARIMLPDGRTVRLQDLGAVSDAASEESSISRFNGQPAISFIAQRAKATSEVKVFDDMAAKLKAVQAANPGLSFQLLGTPVHFVKGMYKSSMAALVEGALLAVLVVFLILKDWRATAIAAWAIPLATIPTFFAMEAFGFTLNMITLIALGLVAGVLVDDAIVEIENIVRHMRMGKSAYQASLEAADEIGLAVVATSATIIVTFLPVSFMTGTNGQFFKEFGITVAAAVFFSLVIARLITPMMAAFFLKGGHHEAKADWMTATYAKALQFSIRRPGITAMGGLLVFVLSLLPVLLQLVPMRFIPRIDNGTIQMQVEFPPGTELAEADRRLREIVATAAETPEVASVFTSVRANNGSVSSATAYLELVGRSERSRDAYAVQQAIRPTVTGYPDVRVSFLNFTGEGRGADLTLEFVGENAAALEAAADALVAQMKTLPELADVQNSASLKRPEIHIRPIPDEAARLGVSASDLANAVRIATSGDVEQNLAKFTEGDRQIPIRVQLRTDSRSDLETIKALRVRTGTGGVVRLDAVADVSFGVGESSIQRRDRQRKVTVSANLVSSEVGAVLAKVVDLPAAKNPPAGVTLLKSGDTEDMAETTTAFGNAMLWAVILIYGVLVLLFRDFFQPITIMTALPLSVGGAFVALMIANQPLSLFVFIGFLMLMGIVTKNSILLVDFAIEQMHKGVSRNQALMEAGLKRARPIIMTTIAMSAGMIPAAAGWGVDGALRQGMGAAVIGGLMLSTLLSLVFVPAVFVLIDRLERLVKPIFGRLATRESLAERAKSHPAE
jgi:HAE1 family hydrophobic/amphiphilic exporter-1